MLYRIAIKTVDGSLHYLVSDQDLPETDSEINYKEIQFLFKLNPNHAHTFSTLELVTNVCKNLPYPYNEKATIILTDSKETVPPTKIYYRIAQMKFNELCLINQNKSFTQTVTPQTLSFINITDAKVFFNSLKKITKKLSCIVEVHDFGPPNYNFKNHFIASNEEFTKEYTKEFQAGVFYS